MIMDIRHRSLNTDFGQEDRTSPYILLEIIKNFERGMPIDRAAEQSGFNIAQFRLLCETMDLIRKGYKSLVQENSILMRELLAKYRGCEFDFQTGLHSAILREWLERGALDDVWCEDDDLPF